MAAPNIVNVTSIIGKTVTQAVGVSPTAIITNSAASGLVLKVNALSISNISSAAADITVDFYRSSTAYHIANTISIPQDATLVAIAKDTAIYLEEGDSIRCTASVAAALEAVCSYEEIG